MLCKTIILIGILTRLVNKNNVRLFDETAEEFTARRFKKPM